MDSGRESKQGVQATSDRSPLRSVSFLKRPQIVPIHKLVMSGVFVCFRGKKCGVARDGCFFFRIFRTAIKVRDRDVWGVACIYDMIQ